MMKKRSVALLLCLLLVFSLSSGALAAEGDNVIELSTAEDLLQLGLRPDASFVLTRDIDMGELDWEPVAFTGKLDGNGHVLYNLKVNRTGGVRADTVDGNNKVYDSVFAGLFSTLINARVENLTLRGVDIQIQSGEHCFVGGFSRSPSTPAPAATRAWAVSPASATGPSGTAPPRPCWSSTTSARPI